MNNDTSLLCSIVEASGGTPQILSKEFFAAGFCVSFGDLTPEAQARFCTYFGSDADDDFIVAADTTWFIDQGILRSEDFK